MNYYDIDIEKENKPLSVEQAYFIQALINKSDIEEIMPFILRLYADRNSRIKQLNSIIPEITENALNIAKESENEYWHALETMNCIFKPVQIREGMDYAYWTSYARFLSKCCPDGKIKGFSNECVIGQSMNWFIDYLKNNNNWIEFEKNDKRLVDYARLVIKVNNIKTVYDYKENKDE
jgi:hypothetical protein